MLPEVNHILALMLCNSNHFEKKKKDNRPTFSPSAAASSRCLLTCPSVHRLLNMAVLRDCPKPFDIKYSDFYEDYRMKSTCTKGLDDRR